MSNHDDFTGERFLPQCTGEIWAEHWHRYLFAARHVAGRDVLDAACGDGYGAAWLARHARSVTGLDIDATTIAAARAKYRHPELRFETGDIAAMPFLWIVPLALFLLTFVFVFQSKPLISQRRVEQGAGECARLRARHRQFSATRRRPV